MDHSSCCNQRGDRMVSVESKEVIRSKYEELQIQLNSSLNNLDKNFIVLLAKLHPFMAESTDKVLGQSLTKSVCLSPACQFLQDKIDRVELINNQLLREMASLEI